MTTSPPYQPNSVAQLRATLTDACAAEDVLVRIEEHEVRTLVDILSAEQFSSDRKRARKELRKTLDTIATRLVGEDRLAD